MNVEEKIQTIKDNVPKVYEAGMRAAGGSTNQVTGEVTATATGKEVKITDMIEKEHSVTVNLSSDTITDFSTVNVIKVGGKNLFDITNFKNTSSVTVEHIIDEDTGKVVGIKTTNNATVTKTVTCNIYVPWGCTFVCSTQEGNIGVSRIKNGKFTSVGAAKPNEPITLDLSADKAESSQIQLSIFPEVGEKIYKGIQIELGNTVTEYEPYVGEVYTANVDGTVAEFTSLYPSMFFFTDLDDVILNVSYKKEATLDEVVNKAIKENNKEIDVKIENAKTEIREEITSKSKVTGSKMAIIGDSISYGVSSIVGAESGKVVTAAGSTSLLTAKNQAWWQLVQQRYGIGEVINNSKSGASFSKDGSQDNPRFTTYLNDTALPEDLDIVMVFGGTNDWGVNTSLGAKSDSPSIENNATFYASVKAVLEYLTLNFADKHIVFVLPLQRFFQTWHYDEDGNRVYDNYDTDNEDGESMFFNCRNGNGLYLYDYVKVLRELCADYGVEVCDIYAHSQMYMNNEAFKLTYAPDGLHPNALGTERYVKNGIYPVLDRLWRE